MRSVLGLVSLLVVLAIVGIIAKQQISGNTIATGASDSAVQGAAPGATPQQQSQQIQQQVKQSVEGVMNQARPMPDDK